MRLPTAGFGLAPALLMFATSASAEGIDERINRVVQPAADVVSGLVFSTFPVAGVDVPFVLLAGMDGAWC
mgnify:CR=1 FL=1